LRCTPVLDSEVVTGGWNGHGSLRRNTMTRAALVLATAGLVALAEPAGSDPSFTVPVPSATAPDKTAPENSAASPAAPDALDQAVPGPAAPPAAAPMPPQVAPPPAASQTASPQPAAPQNEAPGRPAAAEDGRYSFHRIGDNFVRLDTHTGQVAQCGWNATGWSCQAAADERAALDGEIARLQRENIELKKSLLSRGLPLPGGMVAEVPSQPPPVPPATIPDTAPNKQPKGPSNADIDRAIAFMKHVWQRLVDLMIDLQRDIQRKS
jgi:hypothetical protein